MTDQLDFIDIDALKDGFTWLRFEKHDQAKNIRRYYVIGWTPTLFDHGVTRIYGRIGGHRRILAPVAFESLEEAWPMIRKLIERRLTRGYQVVEAIAEVEPVIRVSVQWPGTEPVVMEQLGMFGG